MQGQVVPLTSLTHQWLIISVADSACNTQCEQHLYLSRQLRESLGKDKDRMDWVWLRTGDADVPQSMRAGLSTATVLKVTQADVQTWLQPAAGQAVEDHLYVVDPMGNWMMRFPANIDPLKARKDLERRRCAAPARGISLGGLPDEHGSCADLSPTLTLMVTGLLVALLPLTWVWLKSRQATPGQRLRMLTLVYFVSDV